MIEPSNHMALGEIQNTDYWKKETSSASWFCGLNLEIKLIFTKMGEAIENFSPPNKKFLYEILLCYQV